MSEKRWRMKNGREKRGRGKGRGEERGIVNELMRERDDDGNEVLMSTMVLRMMMRVPMMMLIRIVKGMR